MYRTRFGALSPLALLLVTPFLWTALASAHDGGRWSFSLGVGAADQFTYRASSFSFGEFSENFGFSGLAVAGAAYRVGDHASLRADLGYLGYQKELQLSVARSNTGVAGMWPGGSALTAQMPFVSAGVRLYAAGPASARPRLYVEALPTLWLTRWRERLETRAHYDLYGNYYPNRVDQDAFTTLEPGFTAGAGLLGSLVGRTKLDLGLRYLFSAAAGQHHLGKISSGDFRGLRQLALVMSVQRSF